jgi:hypothetical protein
MTRPQFIADYLPEHDGELWQVEKREPDAMAKLHMAIRGRPHDRKGPVTRLYRKHEDSGSRTLVMSDTDAELDEAMAVYWACQRPDVSRVLINGLGLGLTVQMALARPQVEHVDVVEISPELVAFISQHITDERIHYHVGDAHEFRFPPGTTWDFIWHDIWDTICADDNASRTRLRRRYARKCKWQACWTDRVPLAYAHGVR